MSDAERLVQELRAELAALRQQIVGLESERDRLRAELDRARHERDRHAEALRQAFHPDIPPVTAEELEEFHTKGVPQEEFLREIDRLFPHAPGDS